MLLYSILSIVSANQQCQWSLLGISFIQLCNWNLAFSCFPVNHDIVIHVWNWTVYGKKHLFFYMANLGTILGWSSTYVLQILPVSFACGICILCLWKQSFWEVIDGNVQNISHKLLLICISLNEYIY